MQAGKLDQRITIQRRSRTADGMGGYTETWADVETVWAHVVAVRSRAETLEGQRVTPTHEFRATIRWRQDDNGSPYYTAGDQVIWRGRTYGIESVVEPRNARRRAYLEITMTEGEAS